MSFCDRANLNCPFFRVLSLVGLKSRLFLVFISQRVFFSMFSHLRHPNIVLFMGACTTAGHLAIVTELMPRGSLHDVLHDAKVDLPLTMKLKFARDVALAMNWLHCSHPPIIHRDLKPSNVLVDENWNLKVRPSLVFFFFFFFLPHRVFPRFAILVCQPSSVRKSSKITVLLLVRLCGCRLKSCADAR